MAKGIHLISWDKVILPKLGGGLDIKDMTIMKITHNCNKTLNMHNQMNNIWVNIHLAKYGLPDIWDLQPDTSIWKGLHKDINLLKLGFQKCIVNGINNSVLNHPSV